MGTDEMFFFKIGSLLYFGLVSSRICLLPVSFCHDEKVNDPQDLDHKEESINSSRNVSNNLVEAASAISNTEEYRPRSKDNTLQWIKLKTWRLVRMSKRKQRFSKRKQLLEKMMQTERIVIRLMR